MADIDVKSQSSNQPSKDQQSTGLERPQGGSVRQRGTDPFGLWPSPAEFFSSNPFALMRRMTEEMDRTFAQAFGSSTGAGAGSWYPSIEITERDGEMRIHAELPGIKPEDVTVEIMNDVLTISGERKSEETQHTGKVHRSERRYGKFYREVMLPEGVNAEQAKAQFRDGVLEIAVPVPQRLSNRREIPIQAGEASSTAKAGGR